MPVTIIDVLAPKNNGNFATADATHLLGGMRAVADATARDAITAERRSEGMLVRTNDDGGLWTLGAGLTNNDWLALGFASTLGPITATVDSNDGTGGDPIPGVTRFYRQEDYDSWLAVNGFTSILHVRRLMDALPEFLIHTVTANIAGSDQEADPADAGGTAFEFSGKTIAGGGKLIFQGSAAYTESHTDESISSFQAGSSDPFIDVVGTPFPNDGSLVGRFAITSTGQKIQIHDHTDSRLRVNKDITGTPTTVSVGQQSTVLVNSDDGGTTQFSAAQVFRLELTVDKAANLEFNDIRVDPVTRGSMSNAFSAADTKATLQRFTMDLFEDGGAQDGNIVNASLCDLNLVSSSVMADSLGGGADAMLIGFQTDWSFDGCVLRGSHEGAVVSGAGNFFEWISSVLVDCGDSSAIHALGLTGFECNFHGIGGVLPKIRDCDALAGARFVNCTFTFQGFITQLEFANIVNGPAVQAFRGEVDLSQGVFGGFSDGGGNGTFGIEVAGPHASVNLDASTDVTGATDDVVMSDGTELGYAAIVSGGPISDPAFNLVDKA